MATLELKDITRSFPALSAGRMAWRRTGRSVPPRISALGPIDLQVGEGEYIAIITDERPDEPLKRKHVDVGTRIVVPHHKLKYDQSNPTGHGIVFLSRSEYVFCYVAPGGV